MNTLIHADVLVIGGGIAGLMAAVEAIRTQPELNVVLIDKCVIGKSGSSVQAKGLAGVGKWSFPEDSKELHLEDTLAAGGYLNFHALASRVVYGVEDAVNLLEELGMRFDPKDPSNYSSPDVPSAGHHHYRYINLKDGTGKVIQDVLRRTCYEYGITMLNGLQTIGIAAEDGECFGAVAFDFARGKLVSLAAPSVIIATGGAGYLYLRTSNPPQVTGSGIWLAYQAGASLRDLEMVQFYPVNYVYPPALEGKNVGSYGEAKLYNVLGERFMEHYDPVNLENTTRDRLSQAIYMEIQQGRGTPHGGVVIDRTGLPDSYYQQFPVEVQTTLDGGLDIRSQKGEVSPAAHYLMGGILVDADCRTTLSGLYAAGEAAAGVHGANRLANNSLSDTLVLGLIAGKTAATEAARRKRNSDSTAIRIAQETYERRLRDVLCSDGDTDPFSLIKEVRASMWEGAGVVRTAEGLRHLITRLTSLAKSLTHHVGVRATSPECNPELGAVIELESMLGLGRLIAESALYRTESRGAQYRADFPAQEDTRWLCNIVLRRGADDPLIEQSPVAAAPGIGRAE